RLAISLFAVSTAFFTSTTLASHRISNEGIALPSGWHSEAGFYRARVKSTLSPRETSHRGHDPAVPARRREGRHRLLRRPRHQRGARLDAREGRDPLRVHRQPGPAGRERLRGNP